MKKGEKRRLELLKIAYGMFITKGYDNTSVDGIIKEAGIAKGTYYHYFESKEQMLEEVIEMMLEAELENAKAIMDSDIGIIASIRPEQSEQPIEEALHAPENLIMHNKVRGKIIEKLVPLLTKVAQEGNETGVFDCDKVPERVRMILMLSSDLFDEMGYGLSDIEVFIEVTEKMLGAQPGTMGFLKELIR